MENRALDAPVENTIAVDHDHRNARTLSEHVFGREPDTPGIRTVTPGAQISENAHIAFAVHDFVNLDF
ncbi:hypothetical protein JCM9957A_04990 [Kineosporia succinea]